MIPSFKPPDPLRFWHRSPHDVTEMKLLEMYPPQNPEKIVSISDCYRFRPKRQEEATSALKSNGFDLFDGQIVIEDQNDLSALDGRSLASGSQPLLKMMGDRERDDNGTHNKSQAAKTSKRKDRLVPDLTSDDFKRLLTDQGRDCSKSALVWPGCERRMLGAKNVSSRDDLVKPSSTNNAFDHLMSHSRHSLSRSDFAELGSVCRNAGAADKSIDAVWSRLQQAKEVALSLIWPCLTTNHATSTVKFCTPSTDCGVWHCSCDRHLRVDRAFEPLVGAFMVIADEPDVLYLLPLARCQCEISDPRKGNDESSGSGFSFPSLFTIPLMCSTSLETRWKFLQTLLSDPSISKLVYNFQLAALPLIASQCGLHPQTAHMRPVSSSDRSSSSSNSNSSSTPSSSSRSFAPSAIQNVFDPRVAAYLCESDVGEKPADLELSALFSRFRIQIQAKTIAHEDVGRFTQVSARCHAELRGLIDLSHRLQAGMSEKDGPLPLKLFYSVEMPLAALLAAMELRGIDVDSASLERISDNATRKIREIVDKASKLLGGQSSVNLASSDQVATLLYETLRLPSPSSTAAAGQGKKGGGGGGGPRHASTSEEDLLKIRTMHPVVDMILEFRALSKIVGTYVTGLKPFIRRRAAKEVLAIGLSAVAGTGGSSRKKSVTNAIASSSSSSSININISSIHANWNQTVVRTGRLSCSRPNLQNIPNFQTIGGIPIDIRSIFTASHGRLLLGADYSQIEMRVLAHLCRDKKMAALFAQAGDIYRHMAAQVFGKRADDINDDERTRAKTVCLGVIYGMGPQAMGAKLGLTTNEASRIMKSFFDTFYEMKEWMGRVKSQARQHGYVSTILGRRRYLPDINSADHGKRATAERQSVNSVVQGSASDVIKLAMLSVERELVEKNVNAGAELLLQIHDELIYDVATDSGAAASDIIVTEEIQESDRRKESSMDAHMIPTPPPPTVGEALDKKVVAFAELLRHCMENQVASSIGFRVPLIVNISYGRSWGTMEKLVPAHQSQSL